MSIKNISRLRRARKSRSNIRNQESPRLTVYRSSQHFYAQIFDSLGSKVIVSASTVEKDMNLKSNNIDAAMQVGKKVAERALENGVKKVVFDRSGIQISRKNKSISRFSKRSRIGVLIKWKRIK